MGRYVATAELGVSAAFAWDVLVDLPAYPAWNPFTVEVLSTLRLGEPVQLRVDLGWAGTWWTREVLRAFEPPSRLVWCLELGLDPVLRARRTQTLTPTAAGCRYETEDVIEGALSPLVDRAFGGALERGFTGMAQAFAARCQAVSGLQAAPAPR